MDRSSSLQPSAREIPGAFSRLRWLAGLSILLASVGCGSSEPPGFRLNLQDANYMIADKDRASRPFVVLSSDDDDTKAIKQGRQAGLQFIATTLEAAFGSPDEPYVFEEFRKSSENPGGLDFAKIELASGPSANGRDPLAKRRGLYRQHCVHCHGITGDGAGPTAAFLNPYPRDYRKGMFKFKSTELSDMPTTDDLSRTLDLGIPGTAMPSFVLLPQDEKEALVEYVKYLAIRGQTEAALAFATMPEGEAIVKNVKDDDERATAYRKAAYDAQAEALDQWKAADEKIIRPKLAEEAAETEAPAAPAHASEEELKKSIAAGRELFMGKKANCVSCHGPTGLGDGADKKLYDVWNEFKDKNPGESELWLLPKQELKPRNLRLGIYRGGRRPIDIYRRVHAGIPGSQMPGSGEGSGSKDPLKPEEIWRLVDFVLSLPYAPMSAAERVEPTIQRDLN